MSAELAGYRDALKAVRDALGIPEAATIGDERTQREILHERVMHVMIMLDSILRDDSPASLAWSLDYLRERIAEHPATGYRSWDDVKREHAERAAGGAK